MTSNGPFVLSIETTEGVSFRSPHAFGADEAMARRIAEERFHFRVTMKQPVVTVALMRDGKVFDIYDGQWLSESDHWSGDDGDGATAGEVAETDSIDKLRTVHHD